MYIILDLTNAKFSYMYVLESKDVTPMHEKLRIVSVQEDGIEIITLCLLCVPEACKSHSKADSVQQFILNWLLGMHLSNSCYYGCTQMRYSFVLRIIQVRLSGQYNACCLICMLP
jgi:hypothetical protein